MDPHSFSRLDVDPHSLKKTDPDPNKVNADPKLYSKLSNCYLLLIFEKVQVQFRTWIQIHNLECRIRILKKVSDP
jgi:hypothetical protein